MERQAMVYSKILKKISIRLFRIEWVGIGIILYLQCIDNASCKEKSTIMADIIRAIEYGDYREAEKSAARYTQDYPDRIGGYLLLGRIYNAMNHPNARDNAERLFGKVLSVDPSDYLANLYFRSMHSTSGECINSEIFPVLGILSDQPDNLALFQRLHSGIDNLIALRGAVELRQAASELERIIKSGISHHALYYEMGRVYLALGDAFQAEICFRRIQNTDTYSIPVFHELAKSALLQNNIPSFVKYYINWLNNEKNEARLRNEMRLLELFMEKDEYSKFKNMSLEDKKRLFMGFLEPKPHVSRKSDDSFTRFYKNIVLFIYGTEIDPKEISLKNPAIAFMCAAVPGFIFRGAGHMYAGHKRTGYWLLAINTVALIELSAVVSNGVGCIEGCPDRVESQIETLGIIGLTVFLGTWAYDLIGAPYKCHRDNERKKGAIAVRPHIFQDQSIGLNMRIAF